MITLTEQEASDLIEILELARLELLEAQFDGFVLTSGAVEGLEEYSILTQTKINNSYKEEENEETENYPFRLGDEP